MAMIRNTYGRNMTHFLGIVPATSSVLSPVDLIRRRKEATYARVSNNPGVVLTTVGPGAAGDACAMGEAYYESWPLLHISTQILSKHMGKEKGFYHDGPAQKEITRFSQRAAKQWTIPIPENIIHCDIDPNEFGRNYNAKVNVEGDARSILTALASTLEKDGYRARTNRYEGTQALKAQAIEEITVCSCHADRRVQQWRLLD